MSRHPRVAMTMRLELSSNRFYLGRDYSEALAAAGAVPFHIGLIPDRRYIAESLDGADGVLLPGSDSDVDPSRYGEEPHRAFKRNVPVKDETDLLVLEEAEKRGLPVLAICYGMQILNVFRGGTLIQDIDSQIEGAYMHDQGLPLDRLSHGVRIDPASRLHGMEPSERQRINSHHHQAVDKVGKGLFVSAASSDGVVEAIEERDSDRFVLGVQWHPELTYKSDKFSANIFASFVRACGTISKVTS